MKGENERAPQSLHAPSITINDDLGRQWGGNRGAFPLSCGDTSGTDVQYSTVSCVCTLDSRSGRDVKQPEQSGVTEL